MQGCARVPRSHGFSFLHALVDVAKRKNKASHATRWELLSIRSIFYPVEKSSIGPICLIREDDATTVIGVC